MHINENLGQKTQLCDRGNSLVGQYRKVVLEIQLYIQMDQGTIYWLRQFTTSTQYFHIEMRPSKWEWEEQTSV